MKKLIVFVSLFLLSTIMNLHSVVQDVDLSNSTELGKIQFVSSLYVETDDSILGIAYGLDTGIGFWDPSGGAKVCQWNGEDCVCIGGSWSKGDHLFLLDETNSPKLVIYNYEKQEIRMLLVHCESGYDEI